MPLLQGHTGYMSMKHLPTAHGFKGFMGFLSGSQSYTSDDRWQDQHPVHRDSQFVDPPPGCGAPDRSRDSSDATCNEFPDVAFRCPISQANSTTVTAAACCALCAANKCSHWTFLGGNCSQWHGTGCTHVKTKGAMSARGMVPPKPPGPNKCATSYSTTLYGEMCLQALQAHDASVPFFL